MAGSEVPLIMSYMLLDVFFFSCQTIAQHDPVSKQTDADLQGEVVDGAFSCELVESHSGPVHAVVVHLLAAPCSSFRISAPSSLVCF
jgi:hypothetical protein